MSESSGLHGKRSRGSAAESEKLRSRLEAEQNFHEVQSFVEDVFSDRMARRKLTTAFVDPVLNLNIHLLRSKKSEGGQKSAVQTSTESESTKKLIAEIEELRKANETQKKLQLKLEAKEKVIEDLKKELSTAKGWIRELEDKNDRLVSQIYMIEMQQTHVTTGETAGDNLGVQS